MAQNWRAVARDHVDQLGEGLMWSPRRQILFWVDILAPALRAYDPVNGRVRSWDMPERLGWVIEREGRDDFIIGLKSGFARLTLEPFQIAHIGDPEPERPGNRLNDAKADYAGRIWAGSKNDADEAATGALYRLDTNLSWSRHDDGYDVANGPTFSPDGSTIYHTNSGTRSVYAFDLSPDGDLTNKRLLVKFRDDWGYPDGMTTDIDGALWIAHWGGGRVSRFRPNGALDRSIALPTSQISNCVFAGKNLDRMFVTSAATGLTGEPLAGALFEVDPQVKGVPQRCFGG